MFGEFDLDGVRGIMLVREPLECGHELLVPPGAELVRLLRERHARSCHPVCRLPRRASARARASSGA
jgi:hypothetical protein